MPANEIEEKSICKDLVGMTANAYKAIRSTKQWLLDHRTLVHCHTRHLLLDYTDCHVSQRREAPP